MKPTYSIVLICIACSILAFAVLTQRSSTSDTTSGGSGTLPTNTSQQQVEYYIDRNEPFDQIPNSTAQTAQGTNESSDTSKSMELYESNYPFNVVFPFRSDSITASYRLEPKKLYIVTALNETPARSMLETYLKKHSITLADLQQHGVIVVYEKPPLPDSLVRD